MTGFFLKFRRFSATSTPNTHFCYPLSPIRNLIPLFASVLEDYETTIKTKETLACEFELCKEDNEQLLNHVEREKALRKKCETRLLEYEDFSEKERQELYERITGLEIDLKRLNDRTQTQSAVMEQLSERESQLKSDYARLHKRHVQQVQQYSAQLAWRKEAANKEIDELDESQAVVNLVLEKKLDTPTLRSGRI